MYTRSKLLGRKDSCEKYKYFNYENPLMSNADGKPPIWLASEMWLHILKRFWKLFCLFLLVSGIFLMFYTYLREIHEPSLEITEPNLSGILNENSIEASVDSKNVENSFVKQDQIGIESNIEIPNQKVATKILRSMNKVFDVPKKSIETENVIEPNLNVVLKPSNQQTSDIDFDKHKLKTDEQIQIFPNYYEDDLHSTWKFKMARNYDNKLLNYWTEPVRNLTISNASGQGENGTAFVVSKEDVEMMAKLQMEHNYNVFASERISIRRTLPDFRSPECRNVKYPGRLPTTSVIVVFHNEIWSTLLRTVWSIIDRSPRELLEEIILVDDASTWTSLKNPLEDYVVKLPVPVRIIRANERDGLIRARILGAKAAKGSILTFFDAHVEVTDGWLPPILSRISNDRSAVIVPQIDSIQSKDMRYRPLPYLTVTNLRWHLVFSWMPVPQRELMRTKNDKTAPIRTPSHVGCAFSIDREFFFEIGSYDEGMDIWGSENVELALRVWMCGGLLEISPCSRVGHLYRISTYSFNGDAGRIRARNNNRLVEVWLDEFKEFYYAAKQVSRKVSPGNITDRIELRERLQCKSFRWYLENIYPESTWLKEYNMMGEVKNVAAKKCLDINTTALYKQLIVYSCNNGGKQFFAFAKSGQIVTAEEICIGVDGMKIILVPCSDKNKSQLWTWDSKNQWILHRQTNQCMQNNGTDVIVGICSENDTRSKWEFKSTLRMSNPMKQIISSNIESIK